MESIEVLTGQHVIIQYEPAGMLRRSCAFILDIILMVLYVYIIFISMNESTVTIPYRIENSLYFIIFFPVIVYHFFFEVLTGGRTPGKMIAGTRVANLDGSTPGLTSYFLRWLLQPIDLFPTGIGIGGLFIVFSKYHQRLGDLAAGTVVVRNVKPPVLDLDTDFREFSDDYQPSFQAVELLSEGQIRFISHVLYDLRNKRAITPSIRSLNAKVKALLKIESPLDERTFLETIVRDYNYYAWKGI